MMVIENKDKDYKDSMRKWPLPSEGEDAPDSPWNTTRRLYLTLDDEENFSEVGFHALEDTRDFVFSDLKQFAEEKGWRCMELSDLMLRPGWNAVVSIKYYMAGVADDGISNFTLPDSMKCRRIILYRRWPDENDENKV
jgi:hypothetical protein